MITVSEARWKAMGFSSDFKKYAHEKGIRNPFEVSQKLFAKRVKRNEDGNVTVRIEQDEKGKILPDTEEPTREEKDAYMKMHDEYVARRCFYEISYESFLAYTQKPDYKCSYDISHLRDSIEFVPCKSADHQCSFDCHRYIECALRDEWKPE